MTIHADRRTTGGAFGLIECVAEPGFEPPLHIHAQEDECFYVIEGELRVRRGKEELVLGPGACAFLPRGVPHTFQIVSEQVRFLIYVTPAGFEEYFEEIGQAMSTGSQPVAFEELVPDELMRAGKRYGVQFLL